MIHRLNPDFGKLFKVKVDFDVEMENHDERTKGFVVLLASVAKREGALHLDAAAVATTIEFGARRAGHKEKTSTRFHSTMFAVTPACPCRRAWASSRATRESP